jgi:hypothetical protein
MVRAAALIEREAFLIGQLRFVLEVSRRQDIETELSRIYRELRLLGFKALDS